MKRCDWAEASDIERHYHDTEWGVPVHDDIKLFEMLILEGAQAGLSWHTVLQKREGYRQAFKGFDAEKVAQMSDDELEQLLTNPNIIRNRLKVFSVRKNAIAFIKIQQEFGSFDRYLWQFTEGKVIQNNFEAADQVPASTLLSEKLSKALKKQGMTFVGPTIIYAYMQAIGMVNDHLVDCFRYLEVNNH